MLKIIVKNVPHCCLNNFTSASVILSGLCKLDNVPSAANHIFIPFSGKPFSFSLKSNCPYCCQQRQVLLSRPVSAKQDVSNLETCMLSLACGFVGLSRIV